MASAFPYVLKDGFGGNPGRRWSSRQRWRLCLEYGPMLLLALALFTAFVLDPAGSFAPRWSIALFNVVFLTVLPLFTAGFAIRAYRATGVLSVLALGAGMLAIGCGGGILLTIEMYARGDNAAMTIHNSVFLLAGMLQFAAAVMAVLGRLTASGRGWHVGLAYGVVISITVALLILVLADATPPFSLATSGHTELRQAVVAMAFEAFAFSASIWWALYFRNRTVAFLGWYVAGLALFALGLAGSFLSDTPGDAMNWIARACHMLGASYVLLAALKVPGCVDFGVSIAQSGLSYRPLLDSTSDAVVAVGEHGNVLYWNAAARALFGAEARDVFGRSLIDVILPANEANAATRAELASLLAQKNRQASGGHLEATIVDAKRREFPADIAVYANRLDPRATVCVIRDVGEQKRLEVERIATALHVADLSRRLVGMEEEERRRLARELHDRTSGNLTAIALKLRNVARRLPAGPARELDAALADINALLEDTIVNIRDITSELHPVLLAHTDLVTALEDYCARFSRRTGIVVQVSGPGGELALSPEKESALFRIAQEAVTNASRHAAATLITISVKRSGRFLVLTIADDGAGFDVAAASRARQARGLGLATMRERAEFIGGRLTLDSRAGKGTRITVEVPYE